MKDYRHYTHYNRHEGTKKNEVFNLEDHIFESEEEFATEEVKSEMDRAFEDMFGIAEDFNGYSKEKLEEMKEDHLLTIKAWEDHLELSAEERCMSTRKIWNEISVWVEDLEAINEALAYKTYVEGA